MNADQTGAIRSVIQHLETESDIAWADANYREQDEHVRGPAWAPRERAERFDADAAALYAIIEGDR